MTVTYAVLIATKYLEDAETLQYAAPAGQALV